MNGILCYNVYLCAHTHIDAAHWFVLAERDRTMRWWPAWKSCIYIVCITPGCINLYTSLLFNGHTCCAVCPISKWKRIGANFFSIRTNCCCLEANINVKIVDDFQEWQGQPTQLAAHTSIMLSQNEKIMKIGYWSVVSTIRLNGVSKNLSFWF